MSLTLSSHIFTCTLFDLKKNLYFNKQSYYNNVRAIKEKFNEIVSYYLYIN